MINVCLWPLKVKVERTITNFVGNCTLEKLKHYLSNGKDSME